MVAETGDRGSSDTIVLLAHHDAAHTGLIFHPAPQRWVCERWPALIDRQDTSIPLHWPFVASGAVTAAGALLRRTGLVRLGTALSLAGIGVAIDVGRRPAVPGANDNLTAVAALVAIARRLRQRPVSGARVLLVSCGSEESLQEGMRAFARRRFAGLLRERTWFVNLETLGSGHELVVLEGEGPLRIEDYPPWFCDLVAGCAQEAGVALRRGLRSRASTDSVVANRAGYPVTTLVSLTRCKALANYHWPTDTADNVDYARVHDAVDVGEAVIRRLARDGAGAGASSVRDAAGRREGPY